MIALFGPTWLASLRDAVCVVMGTGGVTRYACLPPANGCKASGLWSGVTRYACLPPAIGCEASGLGSGVVAAGRSSAWDAIPPLHLVGVDLHAAPLSRRLCSR